VLVPFAAGGEREQTLRAERLAERGLAVALAEASLEPAALAAAMARALAAGHRRNGPGIDLDGAGNTAALVERMISAGRSA